MSQENFWQILSDIWNVFKDFIAWFVIIFWLIFFIVGGDIHVKIQWSNVTDVIKTIKSFIQNGAN